MTETKAREAEMVDGQHWQGWRRGVRSLVKSERNDGRMVEFTRANVNGQLGRSFDETRGNGTRVFSSSRLRKKTGLSLKNVNI